MNDSAVPSVQLETGDGGPFLPQERDRTLSQCVFEKDALSLKMHVLYFDVFVLNLFFFLFRSLLCQTLKSKPHTSGFDSNCFLLSLLHMLSLLAMYF